MKTCLVCFQPTGHPTASRCANCQRRWEADRAQRHPQRKAYRDPAYLAYRRTLLAVARTGHAICHLCGKPGANTLDHVVPLSKGGTNDRDNLRLCHLSCNVRKGAR